MARVLTANYHSLARAFSFPHSWKVTLGVLCIAQILSAVGFSMIFPFLPLYIEHLGSAGGHSTELLAGLVISVQGITMMIAAPIWGARRRPLRPQKDDHARALRRRNHTGTDGLRAERRTADNRARPARSCHRHRISQQCLGRGGNAQASSRIRHGRVAGRLVGWRGRRAAARRGSGRSLRL